MATATQPSQLNIWSLMMPGVSDTTGGTQPMTSGQVDFLQERIQILQKQVARLQTHERTLKADKAKLQKEKAALQVDVEFLNILLQSARTDKGAANADETLKRDLLKIAHPDKWSQGQMATELAHEITVVLTKTGKARRSG